MALFLAFRKPRWFKFVDRFLSRVLGKKKKKADYIHTELVFPAPLIQGKRNSFSSRKRKTKKCKLKGVRFAHITDYKNRKKWVFLKLDYPDAEALKIRDDCFKLCGMPYDTLGAIFNAGLEKDIDNPDAFWCSEVCAYVIPEISDDNLTPDDLYSKALKLSLCDKADGIE